MDILSREERFLRARQARESSLLIKSLLRVEGKRQSSSERDARLGHTPEMYSDEREVSLWRPHSDNGTFRFTQSLIESEVRLGAKPHSGNDSKP